MSKESKLAEVHTRAMFEFNRIQSAYRYERLQCLKDRRFYSVAGAQWEGDLGAQYTNKPRFEINKIHLAVIRIINQYRNNRITATFVPKDGSKDEKLTDLCCGLYRADEQRSNAIEAYDNAFEEAVGGGFGAFRLRVDYENEYDFEAEDDERKKVINIEPIYDADSCVFFDIDARRQDKSDAKSCYVLTGMSHEKFEEIYEQKPSTWQKFVHQHEHDWLTPMVVYVAEYYQVEIVNDKLISFKGADGEYVKYLESDLDEDMRAQLVATGFAQVKERKIKRRAVHKYLMSGDSILEDCGYIAGTQIPIIPVYGKRWVVDNVERCMGHVRLSADMQRLKNMQTSHLAELSNLSPRQKPVFYPEQMVGHADMWANDNVSDFPYLLINPIYDQNGQLIPQGMVGMTQPPAIPPAMAALLQITDGDMRELLGAQDQGEQMRANLSGVAVELIQQRLDGQSYIYISNFAKAIERCATVWLDIAKSVYVEPGRKLKTVNEAGEPSSVTLKTPTIDETGEFDTENDITRADFEVNVDIGASSSSKKSATVKHLMNMLPVSQDLETQQVLSSMIMLNVEGEGVGEVRDYFRQKLLKIGAVKPTPEEAQILQQQQQNQPPDPNAEFLKSSAAEAEANAAKARADTAKIIADSELIHAKTMEVLSGIDLKRAEHGLNLLKTQSEIESKQQALGALPEHNLPQVQ